MKARNMTSSRGNSVPNQFIIVQKETRYINGEPYEVDMEYFQSYESIICRHWWECGKHFVELDEIYWDYSSTTTKYHNQFLGETTAETEKKIASGEYILTDLNGD